MECFVLGSGGMMPMPKRRLTSVAVRTAGSVYLFDCGEGTQVPYKEVHLGMRPLKLIAISHRHADHVLGLPGMLMLRAQMPDPEPLTVIGPPGLERFITNICADLSMFINYRIDVKEWNADRDETLAYEDDLVRIYWRPTKHSLFCLGYRLEEHSRPGRFDVDAVTKKKVPRGPLWRKLQQGETVTNTDGAFITPADVLGPPRQGRIVGFVTDTRPTPEIVELLAQADVAFVEGMFCKEHEAEAAEKLHMTAEEAAQLAKDAAAKRLLLIHMSPRYQEDQLNVLQAEAQAIFPQAAVANDGDQFEVAFTDSAE